jgi:hypothetical protein
VEIEARSVAEFEKLWQMAKLLKPDLIDRTSEVEATLRQSIKEISLPESLFRKYRSRDCYNMAWQRNGRELRAARPKFIV